MFTSKMIYTLLFLRKCPDFVTHWIPSVDSVVVNFSTSSIVILLQYDIIAKVRRTFYEVKGLKVVKPVLTTRCSLAQGCKCGALTNK